MGQNSGCTFFDDYEIEAWLTILGAVPTRLLVRHDRSESYEMDRATAVELENGQYALITESGCSCYEASDANIELFPTEERVMEQYKIWLGDK